MVAVLAVLALPVNAPTKVVALSAFVEELKIKLGSTIGAALPDAFEVLRSTYKAVCVAAAVCTSCVAAQVSTPVLALNTNEAPVTIGATVELVALLAEVSKYKAVCPLTAVCAICVACDATPVNEPANPPVVSTFVLALKVMFGSNSGVVLPATPVPDSTIYVVVVVNTVATCIICDAEHVNTFVEGIYCSNELVYSVSAVAVPLLSVTNVTYRVAAAALEIVSMRPALLDRPVRAPVNVVAFIEAAVSVPLVGT